MEILLDDWHDWARLAVVFFCIVTLGGLIDKLIHHFNDWNSKTKDYWYSLTMWTITGMIISGQGILWDYPLGPGVVFALAASVVTLVGLLKRGSWGAKDD